MLVLRAKKARVWKNIAPGKDGQSSSDSAGGVKGSTLTREGPVQKTKPTDPVWQGRDWPIGGEAKSKGDVSATFGGSRSFFVIVIQIGDFV